MVGFECDATVYDNFDPSGLVKHDPNSARCLDLAARIVGLRNDLEKRYDELNQKPNRLPERLGPGERLRDTQRGHRTIININDRKARELEDKYDDECGPPNPPSTPAPKPSSPVKDCDKTPAPAALPAPRFTVDWKAIGYGAAGIGVGVGVGVCIVLEPCPGVAGIASVVAVPIFATQAK